MKEEVKEAVHRLAKFRDNIREEAKKHEQTMKDSPWIKIRFDASLADTIDLVLDELIEASSRESAMQIARAAGGSATTQAKRQAAAENGRKGGRPKKKPSALDKRMTNMLNDYRDGK